MTSLLDAESITQSYGRIQVLRGVSFTVEREKTLAIIGPNGAGKTTLFRALTGEVPLTSGRVKFDGKDVTKLPSYLRVRLGMGRTFQISSIFQDSSVLANMVAAVETRIRAFGGVSGRWYAMNPAASVLEEAHAALADVGLGERPNRQAATLSHGDRKRLDLGIALALRPKLLMMDEPTAGMSHTDREGIVELIRRIRTQYAMTIVMVEHDMQVIFDLADRVLVMNHGEVIAAGSVSEIRANPLVRQVYLGHEMVHA